MVGRTEKTAPGLQGEQFIQYTIMAMIEGLRVESNSSLTGQFTDTHFEDSSPTELKTVHQQN